MNIVLMGMPGVGKGTQATLLKEALGVPHISTGDILREAVREGSRLGRKVKTTLEAGELVSGDVMGELISERLGRSDAREGFILDGFPRTREQMDLLDRVLDGLAMKLDAVHVLVASEEEIVRRLGGRRVCPKCTAVYHIETQPPRSAGVCDSCGSALVQRPDDNDETIRGRLRVFYEETLPLVELYEQRGLLRKTDAGGEPQQVADRLRQALGAA